MFAVSSDSGSSEMQSSNGNCYELKFPELGRLSKLHLSEILGWTLSFVCMESTLFVAPTIRCFNDVFTTFNFGKSFQWKGVLMSRTSRSIRALNNACQIENVGLVLICFMKCSSCCFCFWPFLKISAFLMLTQHSKPQHGGVPLKLHQIRFSNVISRGFQSLNNLCTFKPSIDKKFKANTPNDTKHRILMISSCFVLPESFANFLHSWTNCFMSSSAFWWQLFQARPNSGTN